MSLTLAIACFLTAPETLIGGEPQRRPVEMQVTKQLRQDPLRIEWQAQVRQADGQFLLYRGSDPQSVELVAEVVATDRGTYEVVDATASANGSIYQLTYLDREGREHVLTTVRLTLSYFGALPVQATFESGEGLSPLTTPVRLRWSDPAPAHRTAMATTQAPCGEAPEPPSPPPEVENRLLRH